MFYLGEVALEENTGDKRTRPFPVGGHSLAKPIPVSSEASFWRIPPFVAITPAHGNKYLLRASVTFAVVWLITVLYFLLRTPQIPKVVVKPPSEDVVDLKEQLVEAVTRRRELQEVNQELKRKLESALDTQRSLSRLQSLPAADKNTKLESDPRQFIRLDILDSSSYRYPNYKVYGNVRFAEAAENRYSERSLRGLLSDVVTLSKCSYLVCTFSSHFCRVAYELMQARRGDAGENFHSLDEDYFYGGHRLHLQNDHIATEDHVARDYTEINLRTGDLISMRENQHNGYAIGFNKRSGKTGRLPLHKLFHSMRQSLSKRKNDTVAAHIEDQRELDGKALPVAEQDTNLEFDSRKFIKLIPPDLSSYRPEFLPLAIPRAFADQLIALHSNPAAFFISQFVWYVLKMQSDVEKAINSRLLEIPFATSPIVGVHVRRDDKLLNEAKFHTVEEYMGWADIYFQFCRLAYELMQARRGDAGENFHSLDEDYYFGGQIREPCLLSNSVEEQWRIVDFPVLDE
ncbi:hypothetical protein TELCIR_11400 [Teladorsagia circumcincta]|uniref:GT23 domain-containing protein n=1 Tax=Teladorsagia circumcincta TaxID=45464 RepID=A0A2G9U9E7_TELCI|nr:hypothetical protein TELCIR_11400 [Teladorsagia circumcincta]